MSSDPNFKTPQPDFVRQLGLSVLPHHIRRMLDAMRVDVDVDDASVTPQSPGRAASMMLLLDQQGPLGITEIAQRLQLSHPLITQFARKLIDQGLAKGCTSPDDARFRLIELTLEGRQDASRIRRYHALCDAAFSKLGDEIGFDLLEVSIRAQAALVANPMTERIREQYRLNAHLNNTTKED